LTLNKTLFLLIIIPKFVESKKITTFVAKFVEMLHYSTNSLEVLESVIITFTPQRELWKAY